MNAKAMRQAALELHDLHPADQGAVLAGLDGASRAELQNLLAELQALGIPRQRPKPRPAVLPAITGTWRLARLLRGEPASVWRVAEMMLPPWSAKLLRFVAPRECRRAPECPPAMAAAILQALHRRIGLTGETTDVLA